MRESIIEIRTESQFHYGSIKTLSPSILIILSALSQFHYGSIKTVVKNIIFMAFLLSQFHYGSIKTRQTEASMAAKEIVSIPLWFD